MESYDHSKYLLSYTLCMHAKQQENNKSDY